MPEIITIFDITATAARVVHGAHESQSLAIQRIDKKNGVCLSMGKRREKATHF